ncbi:hypothetical protein [Neorhodopirellula pilleata]|uniref:Uncharacterized protein n=1 Tax=Neorhodopirellula pilleata TaxID=2714738 RepID=A0A5C5ZVN2_9BACT|nr:hypothetical protein [Neorhodopirellula pilleata]TWT91622.1 hypothetical protein Pla100_50130 [Neorhodopirellula pilleata]
MDDLRRQIAKNLDINPDRLRYAPLEDGVPGRLNTEGVHWQIWYREAWRELPWHHEGPLYVTRGMVQQWWGSPE